MKILFISLMEAFPWGGSEELWYKVAKYLRQNGHEISISYVKHSDVNSKLLELQKLGCKIFWRKKRFKEKISIKKKISKLIGFKDKTINDWALLEEYKFDKVFINMGGPYDITFKDNLVAIISQQKLPYFLIQQFNFENNDSLFQLNRNKAVNIFNNAELVFFVSNRNQLVTERFLTTHLSNAKVISNPVNLNSIKYLKYPDFNKKIIFSCVARYDTPIKAQDLLLNVLSNFKWIQREWVLNLYGQGPDFDYLNDLIKFYGLSNKVFLKGHVNMIEDIWKESHIYLLTSLAEGTPLSLIEAMCCGRPCIATDVGGVSEIIQEHQNGYLIKAPTLDLIDETLDEAWTNRDKWEELGKNAFNYISQNYDFDSHIKIANIISDNVSQ